MIETQGLKLYTSQEVSRLLGIGYPTLVRYARKAGVPRRIRNRVRYYTEEEIRTLLQIPGQNRRDGV